MPGRGDIPAGRTGGVMPGRYGGSCAFWRGAGEIPGPPGTATLCDGGIPGIWGDGWPG